MKPIFLKYYKYIRIILWLIPLLFFIFIIYQNLSPFSSLSISCQEDNCPKSVRAYIMNKKNNYLKINTFRHYDQAEVKIEYENTNRDVGLKISQDTKKVYSYYLDKILNQENSKWDILQENGLVLLQKEKNYSSIDNFLNNLPEDTSVIAEDNFSLSQYIKLSDYTPTDQNLIISQPIIGSYNFFTYLDKESLNLDLNFLDLDPGYTDQLDLIIKKYPSQDILVEHFTEEDFLDPQGIKINLPDLDSGLYNIDVITSKNIITNEIKTTQQYISFNKSLFLAGVPEIGQDIYLTGDKIKINTPSEKGFQDINIEGENISISEKEKKYKKNITKGIVHQVNIPQGYINITTPGLIFFSPEHFLPVYQKWEVTKLEELDNLEGINYIFAKYPYDEKIIFNDLDYESGGLIRLDILDYNKEKALDIKNIEIIFSDPKFTFKDLFKF